jgi:thymidylate synthase
MEQYVGLVDKILDVGFLRPNRTGVNTLALFGEKLEFNLQLGFPIVTVKKVNFKNVTAELAGFLRGLSNVQDFNQLGTKIWDANATAWHRNGDLGRIYGVQWRRWRADPLQVDQLEMALQEIKENPSSRRILVTAWRPDELDDMCLPPCHTHFQFLVNGPNLTCIFYMRSVDVFLGLPYDICLYALLTHIVAQQCGLKPYRLVAMLADTHIYMNHFQQAEQLKMLPRFELPKLVLDKKVTVDNFLPCHAELIDYTHGPFIQAAMAV